MKHYFQMTSEETLRSVNGSTEPLTEEQVRANQEKYGPNELVEGKKKTILQIFLEQYKDFLVIILIIAAIASGFMGDIESAAVILIVITMNAILGTVQTVKAEQSLASLKKLSGPEAKVLRNGNVVQIPSSEVTVGDIVMLDAGDYIPADGRLIDLRYDGRFTSLDEIRSLPVGATDSGEIIFSRGLTVGWLPQNPEFPEKGSVLSYVCEEMGEDYGMESEAKSMLNALELFDHGQDIRELSGGQKKRAALCRVLLKDSDILILDEPTNHLDSFMADWLEDYLTRYKGVLLLVTHDRYFLDRVTNQIWEVDKGKVFSYEAG